jgi:phosphopantetheinyl transferase
MPTPISAAPVEAGPVPLFSPALLSDHFQLMNDFLYNQQVVTHRAIEIQQPGSEPLVAGWTARFPLPFPAAVEFISASADAAQRAVFANAVAPLLDDTDRAYFERVIASQGLHRQREWLIGRMAARLAVGSWMSAHGDGAAHAGEIGYDAEGRPVLVAASPDDAVFLSVSHKDGIAVAAAADRPVGIDLERFSAVRDPDGILRIAFSPDEAALLANGHGCAPEYVTIAWSAKEAVAKSLGQKMLGREQSFVMTAFDPANATVRVAHDGNMIDAFYAVEGDFVCTIATPAVR